MRGKKGKKNFCAKKGEKGETKRSRQRRGKPIHTAGRKVFNQRCLTAWSESKATMTGGKGEYFREKDASWCEKKKKIRDKKPEEKGKKREREDSRRERGERRGRNEKSKERGGEGDSIL